MSKRTNIVAEVDKRLRRAQDVTVTMVGGGSALIATPRHAIDGPEHLEATETDQKLATAGHSGLLLPLSGDVADRLAGDGSWQSGSDLPWFDVVADYGATGDGVTDDTLALQAAIDAAEAAGGGVIFLPSGEYVVAGALQDTGRSNAQLLLPRRDYVDTEQITIELRGQRPPPAIVSVIGTTPIPVNHSIIKGTLNTGAGGALLGAHGPVGTFGDFTNLHFKASDLTFRMPSNPVLTALDLSRVGAVELDNVFADVGSYYVGGLTQPTTTTSYGIRLPGNNNGAFSRLGAVNVIGFYTGYEFAEHATGVQVTAWGCNVAAEFLATNHATYLSRFMAVGCPRVLKVSGAHYFEIGQLDIEHHTTGWFPTIYDIDDASNLGVGNVRYHVVLGGVGPDSTFTVNGATGIVAVPIGLATGAALDDLSDVTLTSPVEGDALLFDGVLWTNRNQHWEVLMTDGISNPPDPILNEAGDDWLYGVTT